jgi:hypothetical protein
MCFPEVVENVPERGAMIVFHPRVFRNRTSASRHRPDAPSSTIGYDANAGIRPLTILVSAQGD